MSVYSRADFAPRAPARDRPRTIRAATIHPFPRPAVSSPARDIAIEPVPCPRRNASVALAVSVIVHVLVLGVVGARGNDRNEAHPPAAAGQPLIVALEAVPTASSTIARATADDVQTHRAAVRRRPSADGPVVGSSDVRRRASERNPAQSVPGTSASQDAPPADALPLDTTSSSGGESKPEVSGRDTQTVQPPVSRAAAYLHNPRPEYPAAAREDEQEGLVTLRVRISPQGSPLEVHVEGTSGFALLDRAAVRAVRSWTFTAAVSRGQPIESWMEVPIRFRLREP